MRDGNFVEKSRKPHRERERLGFHHTDLSSKPHLNKLWLAQHAFTTFTQTRVVLLPSADEDIKLFSTNCRFKNLHGTRCLRNRAWIYLYNKTFKVKLSRMDCCDLQLHKQAKLEMQFANTRLGNISWRLCCISSGSLLVQYSDVAFPAPCKIQNSKRLKNVTRYS